MFSKDVLVKFIERSYLNKTVESLIFEVSNKELSCYFSSEKLTSGQTIIKDFDYDDCEIGVYYPDKLLKLLSVLDDEIKIDIKKNSEGNVVSMKFTDKKGKSSVYATSDLDIFDRLEKKKLKSTDYEVKINLNIELIDDFLKAKACIDTDPVHFSYEKNKLYIIFGYSKNNTNQIKFELECEELNDIETLAFDGRILKEILSVNSRKFKSGILQINIRGLMRILFEEDKSSSEYFVIKLTDTEED